MGFLRRLIARIRYRRFEDELREEIESHREMKMADLETRGRSEDDARREAARALGNVTLQREDARRVWIAGWLESLAQDARYAFRSLRKSPGFTATALITLGLGIGLNVSLFTVFNVVVLKDWDVRDPASVVLPYQKPVGNRGFASWMPHMEYEYIRGASATLSGVVARENASGRIYFNQGTDDENDYVQMKGVSWDLFDVLGIGLAAGRGFSVADDTPGGEGVAAVLGYSFARNRFGEAEAAIGKTLPVGPLRTQVTVVGVVHRSFGGFDLDPEVGLYVPLSRLQLVDPEPEDIEEPLNRSVMMAGRLRAGTTRGEAEAELNALDRQFRSAHGLEGEGLILAGTRPISQPEEVDSFLPAFGGLGAAVLLVLLLACANVGNLQLARTLARRRELAVRLSLGAGRRRLVRQLLTESTLLAAVAGAIGFGLALVVPRLVMVLAGEEEQMAFAPDTTVLVFALGMAFVSSLLFALAPALRTTRATTPLALQSRVGIDVKGQSLRSLLLAAQIALSLTLLAGAGLLTRAIQHVHSVDLGFDSTHTATAAITLPEHLRSADGHIRTALLLDQALQNSPLGPIGLLGGAPPLSDSPSNNNQDVLVLVASRNVYLRRPEQDEAWNLMARNRPMSSTAFSALGLLIVAGRSHSDDVDQREAVINERLAGMLFPGEEAVGRTVVSGSGDRSETYVVTGVVRNSYYTTPAEVMPLFHPAAQVQSTNWLVFRDDESGAGARMRALIAGIDPDISVRIAPVTAAIEQTLQSNRFTAALAWAIGILGLTLATIGVFGVFAYAVEERRREIGVRLALGARARDVVRTLFAANRWAVGGGVLIGLVMAVAGGFVLRSYLFGLSPLDPVAYAGVTLILGVAAAAAILVPARRALRVAPSVTLRAE